MPNFVFFGTPEPAVEILEELRKAGFLPSLVVTNPDKPQGRKLVLTPSPVKAWAVENKIPFLQPSKLDQSFCDKLSVGGYQLFIVVAYGEMMSKGLLAIPKYGALNVHYSLLPKYRGASPVESQILNDDKNVGVSIMLIDEKLDHGPIVASQKVEIKDWPPKAVDLRSECNKVAGKLLAEVIPQWIEGKIKAKEQNHSEATYTKKITTKDREIDLSKDSYKNFLKIQAFFAWGTYFFEKRNGKKIRVGVKKAEFKDGRLVLLKVISEGKKEMSYEDFLRGLKS